MGSLDCTRWVCPGLLRDSRASHLRTRLVERLSSTASPIPQRQPQLRSRATTIRLQHIPSTMLDENTSTLRSCVHGRHTHCEPSGQLMPARMHRAWETGAASQEQGQTGGPIEQIAAGQSFGEEETKCTEAEKVSEPWTRRGRGESLPGPWRGSR